MKLEAGPAGRLHAVAKTREVLRFMHWNKSKRAALVSLFVMLADAAALGAQEPGRQAGKPDLRQTAAKPAAPQRILSL